MHVVSKESSSTAKLQAVFVCLSSSFEVFLDDILIVRPTHLSKLFGLLPPAPHISLTADVSYCIMHLSHSWCLICFTYPSHIPITLQCLVRETAIGCGIHTGTGAVPTVFKCSSQKVGVVRGVVTLWTTNCYMNSVTIFILAIVQYSFIQKVLTVVHIQISNQLLPKPWDRCLPLFTNVLTASIYERLPLLTINALIIRNLRLTPLLTINVHL